MVDKTIKAPNYTPELVNAIKADYDGGKGLTTKELAVEYDRPEKSIRGKLVHEKVYVPVEKPIKTFVDNGPSKKELLADLEKFGFSEDAIKGLGNATKTALQEVKEHLGTKVAEAA